jgi:autotransporter strand-loop-strand O-heptosyltransferase
MDRVIIKVESRALGDTIGAMSIIDSYRKKNEVEVCAIVNLEPKFFEKSYPEVKVLSHDSHPEFDALSNKWYLDGRIYNDFKKIFYKFDKPLMKGYAEDLEIEEWERPKIDSSDNTRPIKSKYVCFSMHSTAQCKHWNNPDGWDKLCKMLRKSGLTPVCIDRHETFGSEGNWNPSPKSCVKKHGMDLSEMIRYITHCEFFIGLSSGLSWVAHALGKPVVMISGVTSEDNEFSEDTIRILNKKVCNGCINSKEHKFDPGDWFWCPIHKGTQREFECTKEITPEEVFNQIKINYLNEKN